MIATTVALAVATFLLLAFPSTRLLSIVCALLLLYLNPLVFLLLSVLAVAVAVFIYFHKRSSNHGVPKLPHERD